MYARVSESWSRISWMPRGTIWEPLPETITELSHVYIKMNSHVFVCWRMWHMSIYIYIYIYLYIYIFIFIDMSVTKKACHSICMAANYILRIRIKCSIFKVFCRTKLKVAHLLWVGIGESWLLNSMNESCNLSFTCNCRSIDASQKKWILLANEDSIYNVGFTAYCWCNNILNVKDTKICNKLF
jgi:hypothetical protein